MGSARATHHVKMADYNESDNDESSDNEAIWGWEDLFTEIESFLIRSNREIGSCSYDYSEFVLGRLHNCVQVLSRVLSNVLSVVNESQELTTLHHCLSELIDCCKSLVTLWQNYVDCMDATLVSMAPSDGYVVPITVHGRGRPQLAISRDQLEYLRSLNFSWSEIARLLGVSRMTIHRRRQHFNLDESDIRQSISDQDLNTFLREFRTQMPNAGETVVMGQLRSLGYHVCRQRLREAIRRTDPLNTPLRWQGILTTRRPYSVPAPNSLWHVGMLGYYD